MRSMLSFTTWGGLAMPWAFTAGACIASARPTAVVNVDMASKRRFMMSSSPVVSHRGTHMRKFDAESEKVSGLEKKSVLSPHQQPVYLTVKSDLLTTVAVDIGNRQTCRVAAQKITHTA